MLCYQNTHIDPVLGRYKGDEFKKLLNKWKHEFYSGVLLKTDVREEAFGSDEILFFLAEVNHLAVGFDMDVDTVLRARDRSAFNPIRPDFIAADVRNIPIQDNTFDSIVSTSTLDHFLAEEDLVRSLKELSRVAKSNAVMLLALNNRKNPLFLLCIALGQIFGIVREPVRFFSLSGAKKACRDGGWSVEEEDFIVHITSPVNRFLLTLRRFLDPLVVDRLAGFFARIFLWLGRRRVLRPYSGWFIVLKCRNAK